MSGLVQTTKIKEAFQKYASTSVRRHHQTDLERKVRIALYSHDTMGLGHTRRSLLIAQSLVQSSLKANVLKINGAYVMNSFAMPQGVDCLTLPALYKQPDGTYRSRCLDIPLEELTHLRSEAICSALEAFEPDVLIVDKVPRGAQKELDLTLKSLRAAGYTRCILGLRDVLDDPATVQKEWDREGNEKAIRDYYDAIWVYSDPTVYDPVSEYHLSADVAAKVHYTGYLDQCMMLEFTNIPHTDPLADLGLPPGRFILCLVGGGQDGDRLAETFAHAELPPRTNGIILTGPFMSTEVQQRLRSIAASNSRLCVLGFINNPEHLITRADRIVAMGGYNTICEILSFEKRAFIVPRVKPRMEQMIRAKRMSDLGLLDILHPDDLSPGALTEWMASNIPTVKARDIIDLNGLERIPHMLSDMIYGYWSVGNKSECEVTPHVI